MRSGKVASFIVVSFLLASLAVLTSSAISQQPAGETNPAFAKVVDDSQLPRVLLIGDSISIGYTADVRELLADEANVHRIPQNGGPTSRGLAKLDDWLGDKPWDVIHFNWGLHDLRQMGKDFAASKGRSDERQVPPDEYEANLRALVGRLKKTGAKLIWCSTTPVPEGARGRVPGDEVLYNKIAARIMNEEQIEINDLYAFAKPQLEQIQQQADVHYTPAGSRVLAKQVAAKIEGALSD